MTKIDSGSGATICVSTAGKGDFLAKRVVVAVPLGVLKQGAIAFVPGGLPPANRAAVSRLGVGLLNKVGARDMATGLGRLDDSPRCA